MCSGKNDSRTTTDRCQNLILKKGILCLSVPRFEVQLIGYKDNWLLPVVPLSCFLRVLIKPYFSILFILYIAFKNDSFNYYLDTEFLVKSHEFIHIYRSNTNCRKKRSLQCVLWSRIKKNRWNSHLIIRLGVSERVNELAVQENEQMDEWVAQYFSLYSWIFWTIVPLYSFSISVICDEVSLQEVVSVRWTVGPMLFSKDHDLYCYEITRKNLKLLRKYALHRFI